MRTSHPPLEDLALLGDLETAALVTRDGDVVWLCLPRFDSPAVFARLVGEEENGHWLLRPADPGATCTRRYLVESLVLETVWQCADGQVRVLDLMPVRDQRPDLVRIVDGVRGRVRMSSVLRPRFGYGQVTPWVRRTASGLVALAGPDALHLRAEAPVTVTDGRLESETAVGPGQRRSYVLTWGPSHEPPPPSPDAGRALADTLEFWAGWHAEDRYEGAYPDVVSRSMTTLKALTYAPTGGVVAAATLGLPEAVGGSRTWDYRYCWLRDATFVLRSLLDTGHRDDARAWRDWLLRVASGDPAALQTMYGPAGERHVPEWEAPWLAGYAGSRPVRIGNVARTQFQLDVFGEVVMALDHSREAGLTADPGGATWALQQGLAEHVETVWERPDQGLWETRSAPAHHVHSKVLAWAALDRTAAAAHHLGVDAPTSRWRATRDRIKAEVLERGYDAHRNTFTRSYGSKALDGALLRLPLVGFLPWDDERVRGTIQAVERGLTDELGLVHRYDVDDGLPGHEGAFLACSFWLVQCLAHVGRLDDARRLFDRLLSLGNDVGLLSEEYDTGHARLTGNFPQAFSHVPLVMAARTLDSYRVPA